MPAILDKLRDRFTELNTSLESIRSRADTEARDFTLEETTEVNAFCDELTGVKEQIATHEKLAAVVVIADAAPGPGRRRVPPETEGRITPVETPFHRDKFGFHDFGDFCHSVMGACAKGGRIDERLIANAPTTYATEGAGPDGGFSIPPDYRKEIMDLIQGEQSFFAMTDQQTSSSNTFVYPSDETAPWSTSGVAAYWVGEGKQITESKPVMKLNSVTLHKLAVMVSVTEELAADSVSLDRWVRSKAPAKIAYEIDRCLIHGTGAGQPLGILNSPALVTQLEAGGSGQTADTVNVENIVDMWSRCYGPARNKAVWMINQDVEPQLLQLVMATYNPVYMPPGGLSAAPYGTLLGRPVIPTQLCETLGDKGDMFLVDWSSYLTITRAMRQDTSIHLYFDYDVMAFRFIMRVGGMPKWSTTLASRDGSNTLSPFVVLDERS
jgi:HK97 family phage major capsid protein